MLQLPEHLKAAGKIEYTKEYIKALGMSKQNYYAISREGWPHFTVAQILIVVKKYRIDPRWIFGLQSDTPFLESNKKSNKTVKKTLKILL
jgi:hypothetical protein